MGFGRVVVWHEAVDHVVKASNLLELFRGVETLREQIGGDLRPDWQTRFQDQFCSLPQNQDLCLKVNDRESEPGQIRHISKSDVSRFFNTVKEFISQGGDLVDQDTAEKRAACCVACPNNVPIKGCMGCSGLIPKLLKLVKGAKTTHDNNLRGCSVCGCQLKAKVHLPASVKAPGDEALEFPDWCWVAQEEAD